ncbi:neurotrimin-like, partial [Aphis craccivora]
MGYLFDPFTFYHHRKLTSSLAPSAKKEMVCVIKGNDMPKFAEPITNVTVPVGREATIVCIVDDLGSYK